MNSSPEKSPDIAVDATWLNWLPKIAGSLAFLLIVGYALTFRELSPNANPATWGAFGDYMGGLLNPLISLFTLMVAMKVWGLQKTELLETRKAVEEHGKTAEQQRQEQRFFDLLNIYHRTVDSTTHLTTWERDVVGSTSGSKFSNKITEPVHFRGKEAFSTRLRELMTESFFKEMLQSFSRGDYLDPIAAEKHIRQCLKRKWCDSEHAKLLDSYFRVVFRILAESENLLGSQHDRYAKLLRDQLSRAEIHLLGLSLWLGEEKSERILLANKYCLLEHLPEGHLRSVLQHTFPASVFNQPFAATHCDASATSVAPIIATQED